ncbi:MAG: hypothetical protein CMJ83_01820 [Planctomycetes bacterium]|nr:hypothetical protein [Planctomycetota bacterium]
MYSRFIPALALLLFCSAAASAQWQPPEGYVLVDDMVLPTWAIGAESAYQGTPWTGGNVYYEFDGNVSTTNRTRTLNAMAEIEAIANVDFIERTTQFNYIHIQSSSGNNSFVGMIGGGQTLNMVSWSFKYVICHELFHALGFMHEQSRPDRNTYVTINFANIQSGASGNFSQNSGTTVGAYDFASIMHYDNYDFSSNGQPTISANPGYTQFTNQMGNRSYMTVLDGQGIAARYGQPPAPTITNVTPDTFSIGSGTSSITVTGTRFHDGPSGSLGVQGSRVLWNGSPLTTNYLNPTQLSATVPSSLLTSLTCADVTVENPSPGGGASTPFVVSVGQNCSNLPQWQLNSGWLGATFDGAALTSPYGPPVIVNKGFSEPTGLAFTSIFGSTTIWDALISTRPVVAANNGGAATPIANQKVNIDLTDPNLVFFAGLQVPTWPTWPTSFTLNFNAPPFPITISVQAGIVSAFSADGIFLSQAAQLEVNGNFCGNATPFLLGDDDSVLQTHGFPMSFYGSTWTNVYVGSNGYLTFGQPDTGFTESLVNLWGGPPRIAGLWDDLSPNQAGTVSWYTDGAASFAVCYDAVTNYNQGNTNTFSIAFTQAGNVGSIAMDYGQVDTTQAMVALAPGGNLGFFQALDVTGPQVPLTQQVVYELFSSGTDLSNATVTWTLASGYPATLN